jgi:hypothetical protein
MKRERIISILENHYITWAAGPAGKIYALETWKDTKTGLFECEMTDVTGWSKKQLLDWLGY